MTEIGRKVLIYSTWLVLGIVQVGLGVERLVKTWREGAPPWRYVLGAVMIVAGVILASLAGKAAQAQNAPNVKTVRNVTTVLALFIFGTPLIPVLAHGLAILGGRAGVSSISWRNLLILGLIGMAYVLAIAWAKAPSEASNWVDRIWASPTGTEDGNDPRLGNCES